jgi:hypothetical protein
MHGLLEGWRDRLNPLVFCLILVSEFMSIVGMVAGLARSIEITFTDGSGRNNRDLGEEGSIRQPAFVEPEQGSHEWLVQFPWHEARKKQGAQVGTDGQTPWSNVPIRCAGAESIGRGIEEAFRLVEHKQEELALKAKKGLWALEEKGRCQFFGSHRTVSQATLATERKGKTVKPCPVGTIRRGPHSCRLSWTDPATGDQVVYKDVGFPGGLRGKSCCQSLSVASEIRRRPTR